MQPLATRDVGAAAEGTGTGQRKDGGAQSQRQRRQAACSKTKKARPGFYRGPADHQPPARPAGLRTLSKERALPCRDLPRLTHRSGPLVPKPRHGCAGTPSCFRDGGGNGALAAAKLPAIHRCGAGMCRGRLGVPLHWCKTTPRRGCSGGRTPASGEAPQAWHARQKRRANYGLFPPECRICFARLRLNAG
jgi:hypothetical protein